MYNMTGVKLFYSESVSNFKEDNTHNSENLDNAFYVFLYFFDMTFQKKCKKSRF